MVEEYESEVTATRDEVAETLRDVADGVDQGAIHLGAGEDGVEIDVPEEMRLEVEFEVEADERELEIEVEWSEQGEESPTMADDV